MVVGSGPSGNDIFGYLAPVARAVYLVYHTQKVRYKMPPMESSFHQSPKSLQREWSRLKMVSHARSMR